MSEAVARAVQDGGVRTHTVMDSPVGHLTIVSVEGAVVRLHMDWEERG